MSMKMIPADTALYVGASLTATGKMVNSYGDTYPSQHIHYQGLDPSVSVTPWGKVTGISYGRARIVARREDFIDTGFVSVVPPGVLGLGSFSSVDFVNNDGSGFVHVASPGQGLGEAPAWVPGGDTLVYSYGIPGGAGAANLYVTDLAGNHHLLAAGGRDPRVSPDGWVYFTGADVIERIHLDGTGREIVIPTTVAFADPSPDGSMLAYFHIECSGGFGCGWEIRIRTVADSTSHLLVTDGARPRWSPDGSRIAFYRPNPNTDVAVIYVIDTAGTNLQQVSPPGRLYHWDALDWSPDGAWILASGLDALELIRVSDGLALPLGYTGHDQLGFIEGYQAGSWRR